MKLKLSQKRNGVMEDISVTADKVNHKLTVNTGGDEKTFDGSEDVEVNVQSVTKVELIDGDLYYTLG